MSEESPRISPQERAAAAIAAAEEAARREEYLARRGSLAEEKFEAAQASATAPLSSGSVPPALDPRNFDFPSDAARRAEASEHEWLTPSSPGDGGPPPKTRSVSRAQSPTAAPFLPCPASVLKSSTRESSTFPETQHCLPKLQLDRPPEERLRGVYEQVCVELLVFGFLNLMFLLSYWLAVATPAGSIPRTSEWQIEIRADSSGALETKRGGGVRQCKWCKVLKPDRAHHCRVCRQCVLKMDHHCPWIFNCVGFGNHKFFFLAVGYGVALSLHMAVTMMPSVKSALSSEQESFEKSLMLLFAETLDIFLCALISGFFLFHSYLVLTAQTTIEFCESRFERLEDGGPQISWSRGVWRNICDALGPEPLLWVFPVDNRTGDGLFFRVGKIFYASPPPSKLGVERSLSAAKRLRGFDPIVDPEA